MFGVFDGIADQIGQNAPKAQGVAQNHGVVFARANVTVCQNKPALAGHGRQGGTGILQDDGRRERNFFQLQFHRFDFRQVKNVVDDLDQILSGLEADFQQLAM